MKLPLLVSLVMESLGCTLASSVAYRRLFVARDEQRAVANWLWCLLGTATTCCSGLLAMVAGLYWRYLDCVLLLALAVATTWTAIGIDREKRRRRASAGVPSARRV